MEISDVLSSTHTTKDGVIVPGAVGDETVWDDMATSDLLDAATSSESEAHMASKGRPQIETLKAEASEGVILDLGCGYGRMAEQLLPERTFAGYIGLDSSVAMLRFAQERKTDKTYSTPLHWVYGEIDAIPLKDASVDTVIVSAVFLHNHKSVTTRSIQEIYRVLKPGGKLFVFSSFPNLHTPMGYQVATYLAVSAWYLDPYRNGPTRYFSRREVRNMLASFSETEFRPFGFSFIPKRILFFPSFINYVYRFGLAEPLNGILRLILPGVVKRVVASHHDVVATK